MRVTKQSEFSESLTKVKNLPKGSLVALTRANGGATLFVVLGPDTLLRWDLRFAAEDPDAQVSVAEAVRQETANGIHVVYMGKGKIPTESTMNRHWNAWYRGFLTRKQKTAKEEISDKVVKRQVERLLSRTALQRLRTAFGPLGLAFFEFYRDLAYVSLTGDIQTKFPDGNLWEDLRQRVRMISRTKLSPIAQNQVQTILEEVKPWLRAIERNPQDHSAWRRWLKNFGPLIPLVAKDKGVFLKGQVRGADRWFFFRMMRPKEAQLEQIRDNDPALFDAIQKQKGQLRAIEESIETNLQNEGLDYKRGFVMGRTVFIGTDPVTSEKVIYDFTTQGMPYDQYLQKRKAENKAISRQSRVFPSTQVLNGLRKKSLEELEQIDSAMEFASLTDDRAKKGALTRIFPVKVDETGRRIIVKGRFAGIYLDEMVNVSGRMLEGTAYNYNPRTNRYDKIEVLGKDGKPTVRAVREPYVTVAELEEKERGRKARKVKKLFVKIPSSSEFTEIRNQMFRLAKLVPSIQMVEKSRRSEYYFEPKDFNAVREALQSMSLSEAASKFIKEYFEQLARAEMATAKENLSFYTMDAIGGFKQTVRGPGKGLLVKQMQALAWMESRGNNGVCALDTGIGKTVTSIAMMQKLKRDGLVSEGNGRFLFVCPKALRGNIKKEIWKFLTDDERRDLLDRLDVLTYPQFANAFKKNPHFADEYVAIFFDEAQELRSGRNQVSKAALKINHPRKILLTASPIEKEPMDAYVLAAIANNIDVSPGTEGRRDMLKFQRRFTETVGRRTVGIKQDPLTKLDLQTWVKQNIFYSDKQDVEEFQLPKLKQEVVSLSMDPEVEDLYRQTVGNFTTVLRGMVAQFQYRGVDPETGRRIPEAREKKISLMFSAKLAPLIRRLNDLANFPERFVPRVAARNPDGSKMRRSDGSVVMQPTQNPKLRESLRIISENYMNGNQRTLLFTDDAKLVVASAQYLSTQMPGVYHMAANGKSIHVFQNGKELKSFMGFDVPFREKKYKRFMDEPANETTNKNYERPYWQSFVFNEITTPNHSIVSVTLHGQVYQTGQNLQAFSNVIHLDRDTWNSEDMKQRTARAWRQGQENPVTEYTLDVTYDRPSDIFDRTLDEIRGYLQAMDEDLFNQIIKQSQVIALGREYYGMNRHQARFFDVNRKSMMLALSPYLENATEPSIEREAT